MNSRSAKAHSHIDEWLSFPKTPSGNYTSRSGTHGSSRDWTKYHEELLELADAPGLPASCPRQIAEAFLDALKEDDQATLGAVSLADHSDWSDWHAKLKKLPEFQKLAIAEVYADKGDNMALATAINPDGEESGRLAIYLNFRSGAVWRVRTLLILAPEEREIADRVFKRFLEKHPDAKLVPRTPDGQPVEIPPDIPPADGPSKRVPTEDSNLISAQWQSPQHIDERPLGAQVAPTHVG